MESGKNRYIRKECRDFEGKTNIIKKDLGGNY